MRRIPFIFYTVTLIAFISIFAVLFLKGQRADAPVHRPLPSPTNSSAASLPPSSDSQGDGAKSNASPVPSVTAQPSALPMPTPSPEPSTNINLSLIRAGQVGDQIQFRVYVGGAVSGECQLTYSYATANSLHKTGTIMVEVDGTTDCVGLDIPVINFPNAGTWNATLVATSGTNSSAPLTHMVTVTK